MQLLVRPAAAADIEEAYRWYEQQRAGLGEEFLAAVDSILGAIAAHPTTYPVIHQGQEGASPPVSVCSLLSKLR